MSTQLDIGELLDRATFAADAPVRDLEQLHGGVSSLTYSAYLDDRRVVIKVAPPGLPPVRNRDVLRQARVLKALAGAPGVNVPEVLVEDAGTPPFFIMSFVPGDSYEPKKDISDAPPSPEIVRARALACAEMLARLQAAPPPAGEPAMPLREELDRWERLYSTVPEELHHGQRALYERLAATLPAQIAPTILHGDYRIGNMQFDGEHLAAIIDWEIWSLGDPRTDLAWLLTWLDPVQRFYERRSEADERAGEGLPSRPEMLAAYGDEPPDLPWFEAYCRYKMASTTAVLIKQSRRRETPYPHLEVAATTLPAMIERGLAILDADQSLADVAAGEHVDQR
jgi:aminoglycoside phosphotransferase (APT) family kinase protein